MQEKRAMGRPKATPTRNLQTIFSRFATQIQENARESARLGTRFNQLQTGLARRRRDLETVSRQGAAELAPLLELSVEAYSRVSRHLIACVDDLLSLGEQTLGRVLEVPSDTPQALPQLADIPRIALRGRPGETIEAEFVIQNDFDFPVSFQLRCPSEGAQERSTLEQSAQAPAKYLLSFTPQTAHLAPDSHSVVRLCAQLAADITPDVYLVQVAIDGLAGAQERTESKCFCVELQVAA